MVAHCDKVFRISLTVQRERIGRGCRGDVKHLFYVTTKDELPPGRMFIPKWRLMTRLLVLPQMLMEEIQKLGYKGCFSYLARFLAPWRKKPTSPVTLESTIPTANVAPLVLATNALCRQVSPQVAAALLGKLRPTMTTEQESIVDALKKKCPGYAVMRGLVMGFRTILRTGSIETLQDWMNRATDSGIYGMQRFVRGLKQDQSAVEAAVKETWSNGPVEGHISRLKHIKRQMYGRAGFELLRARVLPLTPPASLHQK